MYDRYAIECDSLTKRFGEFIAVDKLTFKVRQGEIFGFLGPNGSGKSTTIRMLCGIITPTEGKANVAGYDVARQSELVRQNIGYMSQKFSLYEDLTVFENLSFFSGIYGLSGEQKKNRIDEVIALTDLRGQEKALVKDLSMGVRQRLALGGAILHQPPILFLDEPTSGVDPVSRRLFWDLIYELAGQGITILVTTHFMDEAERCGRILLIKDGLLCGLGSPNELKKQFIPHTVISVSCSSPFLAIHELDKLDGIVKTSLYGRAVHMVVADAVTAKEKVTARLSELKYELYEIENVSPSMEDVFLAVAQEGDIK